MEYYGVVFCTCRQSQISTFKTRAIKFLYVGKTIFFGIYKKGYMQGSRAYVMAKEFVVVFGNAVSMLSNG